MSNRNFTATVKEPAGNGPSGVVPAVSIELSRSVPGLPSEGVLIFLADNATIEDAERIARDLNRLGAKIVPG